jgi:hypothetical protein
MVLGARRAAKLPLHQMNKKRKGLIGNGVAAGPNALHNYSRWALSKLNE